MGFCPDAVYKLNVVFLQKSVWDPAILILEASPKTARFWRAVFGLQSGEFAPEGRELSALKLILRIAVWDLIPHRLL